MLAAWEARAKPPPVVVDPSTHGFNVELEPSSFCRQWWLLTKRAAVLMVRDPLLYTGRMLNCAIGQWLTREYTATTPYET